MKKWRKKEKKNYPFFIELKSNRKMIGFLELINVKAFEGSASTGSWINKKYWKNGYMTEAKLSLNEFAFNELNLQRLESQANVENTASNTMSKKLGYKFEGTRRRATKVKATGKLHDSNIWGLLKEDWKKALPSLKKKMESKIKSLQ